MQEECVGAEDGGVGGVGVDGPLVHVLGLVHVATLGVQEECVGAKSDGIVRTCFDREFEHVVCW